MEGENERAAWIFSDNHLNFRGSTEGYYCTPLSCLRVLTSPLILPLQGT